MASPTEEFISSFHSLSGITIGERRKNLFLLLNKNQNLKDEIDFSSIHPQTPLEETFKVDALIYYRRIPELLDVLKSENPVLIKKVLKNSSWFLEQAFQSLSGDELVTVIFPYVSFNVKVKIINKLSLYLNDVKKSDEIFKAIRLKYGSYLAFKLLPSCSQDLILETLKSSRVKFSTSQLLIIIKKYPEMSKTILDALNFYLSVKDITFNYHNIFVYLAKTHSEIFLELLNKYNFYFRLGWRATHRFISKNKEIVIKDANNLHKLLHRRQSLKTLRQDYEDFYINLFPPSIDQFWSKFSLLHSFLGNFRTDEEKLNLLETSFRKMYSYELLEYPGPIIPSLLELVPLNKRESISYKPSNLDEDNWISYMGIERSIPYLKKRISLSSDVKTREDLIILLVYTCKINKDLKALGEVCKYVVNQHRNDFFNVRFRFLLALRRNFELHTLEEEHWKYVNELIQIFEMNREHFEYTVSFLIAYLYYRLLNNLDVREELTKYITIILGNWNLFRNNPVFEKKCLLLTWELIPQIYNNNDSALKKANIIFLTSLVDWNNRHPEDEISLFNYPAAMDFLKEYLTEMKDAGLAEQIIHYILKLKLPNDSDLLRLCLTKLNLYFANRYIVNWLIYSKPLFVIQNVDIISRLVFNCCNHFFWRQCRNYSHLDIPQKFGQACLDALVMDESRSNKIDIIKRNAIIGLSYIMNANKFIEFASDYYPTELRADALNEEAKNKYKLQRAVSGSLKNIIPPSLALESVLNFSKGDYLKLIQSSLYSVSGNVNEDKLALFFNELGKRAVSVRKHAFHLTLRVLERSQIFNVFSKFMQTEKNSSIRKFLVKGSFHIFIQDPDDNLWELVKSNLSTVNVDDKEIVQIMVEINKIPLQYLSRYIIFMWEFLGNLSDPNLSNEREKFRLLNYLSADNIKDLPKNFCLEIIDKYLFKFDFAKQLTCNFDSFACKFIIYCASEGEREAQINRILPLLKNCLSQGKYRFTIVFKFLKQFCLEFLDNKCNSKEILLSFGNIWNNYIKPYEAFDHYLYLQFCLIYVDSLNYNWSPYEIGENLAKFIDTLSKLYGNTLVSVISDMLVSFVRNFLPNTATAEAYETNRYLLIEGMIKGSNSSQTCVLLTAISLLKRAVEYSQSKLKHNDLVQFLNKLDDPIIQIHLNHHLYRF